jgi:hypothetical protein
MKGILPPSQPSPLKMGKGLDARRDLHSLLPNGLTPP